MGIFFKSNLQKIIDNTNEEYTEKIRQAFLVVEKNQGKERTEMLSYLKVSTQAVKFAITMTPELFNPMNGLFRSVSDDIDTLKFGRMYHFLVLSFFCFVTTINTKGEPTSQGKKVCADCMEKIFGISRTVTETEYDGLVSLGFRSMFLVLYRWSTLSVGYLDHNYDTLHEESPDYIRFYDIALSSIDEAVKVQ